VREGRLWTLTTAVLTIPFVGVAVGLTAVKPFLAPIGLIALAHAWAIPELYAARGAGVVREVRRGARPGAAPPVDPGSERVALGLLGDLVGHEARELVARTRLAVERGTLGVWLVGESGAVLVRPGGRRVYCYCVRTTDQELPPSDRVAHLLLALRTDELGFVTVANLAFSGARWRLRRRVPARVREALDAAVAQARLGDGSVRAAHPG
jgi:hypothetical protein